MAARPAEYWLAHGDDERISIDNIRRGAEIVYAIVRETAGKR